MTSLNADNQRLRGLRLLKTLLVTAGCTMALMTLILSVPLTAQLMFDELQVYPPLPPAAVAAEAAGPPAAIVILSAGRRLFAPEFGSEFDNQSLDGLSLDRLRYGAFLARKTSLPVLVSGGLPETGRDALADLMAKTLAIDYGIRPNWVENESSNTAENAILSAAMLKQAGIGHIVLVTHAWHMKRAVAAFAANGISVTPAPTAFYRPATGDLLSALSPNMATLRMSGYAIHEIVGGIWYKVRYGY